MTHRFERSVPFSRADSPVDWTGEGRRQSRLKPSLQRRAVVIALFMGIALTHGASSVGAQELEPRAYRALPVGLHFGLLVYSFSTGNVVVDPTTPVEGFEPVNRESNSRLGLTLSIPLSRKDSLKLAGHTGAFTRAGIDFDVGILGYQRMLAGGGAAKTNGE